MERATILSVMDYSGMPRLISIGTSNPPDTYTQEDLLSLYKVDDPFIRRFYENSHIAKRHLVLPKPDFNGNMPVENGTALLNKHRDTALAIGASAIDQSLSARGLRVDDVDALFTVTTTGMLCPSLSALLVQKLGFRPSIHRGDIVGMGCNAGVNGVMTASQYAKANPGKKALLVACEICSAAYVFDMRPNTGVVNSLFGDGCAAALIQADKNLSATDGPMLIDFEPLIVHEVIDQMRFDFEEGKFNFYLGRDVPYLVGENIRTPVQNLMERNGLKKRDIAHWLVHSGGKKVIDAIKYNLGLTEHDVRHTRTILRDFGNLSSAAFLFSYEQLKNEGAAKKGDWGIAMAFGPGISLETGLLRW